MQASGTRTVRQRAYRDQHDIRDSGFSSRDSFCSYSMECLSFPQRESAGHLVSGGKGWNRAPSADTNTVSGTSDVAPRKRSPTALPQQESKKAWKCAGRDGNNGEHGEPQNL